MLPAPPRQPRWKKMAGILPSAIDGVARLPGTIGLIGRGLSLVKNLINVEGKFVDTSLTPSPDSATGTVSALTLTAQGSSDQQRTGNSVLAKRIDLRGFWSMHASATLTTVRYLLVLDKQNAQGTAPTVAQILQNVNPNSFMHMNNSDRFVVLKSGFLTFRQTTETQGRDIELHQDLSDLHIKYDGTAADQASASENHIYFVAVSNEAINTPSFSGFARLRYYDN